MVVGTSIGKVTARVFEDPTDGADRDGRLAWSRVTLACSAPGLVSKASEAERFRAM